MLTFCPDAISDILIWGYAENGIGMIVGCVGTLRPLFRKVLHLGGSESDPSTPRYGLNSQKYATGTFPSNARRTYKDLDTTYELEDGNGSSAASAADKYGTTTHETQIKAGYERDGSLHSDSDSQKQILDESGGIMVHSHVQVSRE